MRLETLMNMVSKIGTVAVAQVAQDEVAQAPQEPKMKNRLVGMLSKA